ncbi:protein FAM136A [Exaiptasia diaphana]|uniref:Protein FAM136A n=1 Tax=Exaiptasia diaphana TaxID=2652724 RepID=A0A913X6L8_EXADI|nr:protein FAM136A [Exaiptasia diaphana]KXJ15011.1 Protein FAM136A [Exaiptasia diaphana]
MAAAGEARVKDTLERSLEIIERDHLRPIQGSSHICASKCCENKTFSKDGLQQCMNRCFQPLQEMHKYIEQELGRFQGRISRCAQECQDKVQDKVDTKTSQADIAVYQQQVEKCVENCCNSHIDIAKNMFEKMKKVIAESAKAVK